MAHGLAHSVHDLALRLALRVVRRSGVLADALEDCSRALRLLAQEQRAAVAGEHVPLHVVLAVRLQEPVLVRLLSLLQGPLGLLRLHPRHALEDLGRAHELLALQHFLFVPDLAKKGSPDIFQPDPAARLELPAPPDDLLDLPIEGLGVHDARLHLGVGVHEDGQQHVQQQHRDHHHKDPEPERRSHKTNLLHLRVVPVPEHDPEARDRGPVPGREVLDVLAEEQDCVHHHARVDREEDDEKVRHVRTGIHQRPRDNGEAGLCVKGLEEPGHDDHGINSEGGPVEPLAAAHCLH
mmetsp:Transcript_78808/g.222841  ORF Transcript_78808/g.222841 Transcript_78808/m.222841 type:complete len:294 (-) Transcript_78808:740-1621(-)